MDQQRKALLRAWILTVGLLTWAESLSIDANSLVFSDDLDPEFFPCKSWTQVCENGESIEPTPRCTTHEELFFARRRCLQHQPILGTEGFYPGKCGIVNGRCSFSRTQPFCVQSCRFFNYQCTTVDELLAGPLERTCPSQFPASSTDVCIPENGGCAFRNPCVTYRLHCFGPYRCGSLADYARFLTSSIPPCAFSPFFRIPLLQPGECLYQDGQCRWSECRTWPTACGLSLNCGSTYEYELSLLYPRPQVRCAFSPITLTPVEPASCEFSEELGKCAFTECEGGKEFQECGSPCPDTCDGIRIPDGHLVCPTICLRGCFCPTGTVLHEDQCILPHQCPVCFVQHSACRSLP